MNPGAPHDTPPPSSRVPEVPTLPRDTDATSFTDILDSLITRVGGAYAAALVDSLGETVDYAGRGDPFDVRLAAAHLQLVLAAVQRFGALGEPRWIVIRGRRKSIAASVLPDGYVLVVLLRARAGFTISPRALAVCVRALAREAGWREVGEGTDVDRRSWFDVDVVTDRRGRPTHLGKRRVPVEVIGAVVGLSVRERGYRVRTAEGTELTLVREPQRRWYADEPA